MLEDFLHVSITCRNIDSSIDFYERIGLTMTKRLPEVVEDGIMTAFRLPKGRLSVAYLSAPQGRSKMFIDLVQWLEPEAAGQAYPVLNNVGLNRLAFRVKDLDATVSVLKMSGIEFLSEEPQRFGDGIRSIVTTDPDGTFVQLVEGL